MFNYGNIIPSGVKQTDLYVGEILKIVGRKNKIRYLHREGAYRALLPGKLSVKKGDITPEEICFTISGGDVSEVVGKVRKYLCYICGVFGITEIFWRVKPQMARMREDSFFCEFIGAFIIGE